MAARSLAVWLLLIVAEIVHGIARGILLVPRVGEFRSNQIGVFTGSITSSWSLPCFPSGGSARPGVQTNWRSDFSGLFSRLAFEITFGRLVVGASWERIAADYRVLEGGWLPFGMLILLLSPLIAGKFRMR